ALLAALSAASLSPPRRRGGWRRSTSCRLRTLGRAGIVDAAAIPSALKHPFDASPREDTLVHPFRTSAPAKRTDAPSASSILSPSFHLAMRSERANEPTFNCFTPQPTARCTIETSSVSPERAERIAPKPAARAALRAANVSVTVPAWLGLRRTALQAPIRAARPTRAALVTR